MSKEGNSEVYVVCTGYMGCEDLQIRKQLRDLVEHIGKVIIHNTTVNIKLAVT